MSVFQSELYQHYAMMHANAWYLVAHVDISFSFSFCRQSKKYIPTLRFNPPYGLTCHTVSPSITILIYHTVDNNKYLRKQISQSKNIYITNLIIIIIKQSNHWNWKFHWFALCALKLEALPKTLRKLSPFQKVGTIRAYPVILNFFIADVKIMI